MTNGNNNSQINQAQRTDIMIQARPFGLPFPVKSLPYPITPEERIFYETGEAVGYMRNIPSVQNVSRPPSEVSARYQQFQGRKYERDAMEQILYNRDLPNPGNVSLPTYQQQLREQQGQVSANIGQLQAAKANIISLTPQEGYTYTLYGPEGNKYTVSSSSLLQKKQELLPLYDKAIAEQRKTEQALGKEITTTRDWDPKTKIQVELGEKGTVKYTPLVKYRGQLQYHSTLKEIKSSHGGGFGGLLATAFTAEDPLGLKSAIQVATGDKEGARRTKVEAYRGIKDVPFHEYYIKSPITQIGLAAAGGMAIGGISKTATAAAMGKTLLGATAIRGAKLVIGGGLTYLAAKDIQKSYWRGGFPEAIAKGTVTGLSFASGAAGYKSVTPRTSPTQPKFEQPSLIKESVKRTAKFIPRVYENVQQKFPTVFKGTRTESGRLLFPTKTGAKVYQFGKDFQTTRFYRNLSGWAIRGYVPSKTYLLRERPVYEKGGMRVQRVKWVKQRTKFTEGRKFMPKEAAQRFYRYVEDPDVIKINFPKSRTLTGGDIQIEGIVQGKTVNWQRGFFERTLYSSNMAKQKPLYTLRTDLDMSSAQGSFYRNRTSDIILGLRNKNIFSKVSEIQFKPVETKSLFGQMVEQGYWTTKYVKGETKIGRLFSRVKVNVDAKIPEFRSGFGARYRLGFPKSSTQWKKTIPPGFDEASAVLGLQTRTIQVGKTSTSLLKARGLAMDIPIRTITPKSLLISPIASLSISRNFTTELQKGLGQRQRLVPLTQQIKMPIIDTIRLTGVRNLKQQIVRQTPILETASSVIQIPALAQRQEIITKQDTIIEPFIDIPTIHSIEIPKTFNINKSRLPIPVGLTGPIGGRAGGGSGRKRKMFTGYRYRKWKVPTLEDFLKGGI